MKKCLSCPKIGCSSQVVVHTEHPVELKEGMVIAVEAYDGEGINGARIEEEVVITDNDPEVITKFPSQELISCGCKY